VLKLLINYDDGFAGIVNGRPPRRPNAPATLLILTRFATAQPQRHRHRAWNTTSAGDIRSSWREGMCWHPGELNSSATE